MHSQREFSNLFNYNPRKYSQHTKVRWALWLILVSKILNTLFLYTNLNTMAQFLLLPWACCTKQGRLLLAQKPVRCTVINISCNWAMLEKNRIVSLLSYVFIYTQNFKCLAKRLEVSTYTYYYQNSLRESRLQFYRTYIFKP